MLYGEKRRAIFEWINDQPMKPVNRIARFSQRPKFFEDKKSINGSLQRVQCFVPDPFSAHIYSTQVILYALVLPFPGNVSEEPSTAIVLRD
jgi:hypothetical protein